MVHRVAESDTTERLSLSLFHYISSKHITNGVKRLNVIRKINIRGGRKR